MLLYCSLWVKMLSYTLPVDMGKSLFIIPHACPTGVKGFFGGAASLRISMEYDVHWFQWYDHRSVLVLFGLGIGTVHQ